MNNTNSPFGPGRESPLDRAIDRAVRQMMDVNPPAGLARRVLASIKAPAPGRWAFYPRYAAAALAMLVLAVLLVPRPSESPAVVAPPRAPVLVERSATRTMPPPVPDAPPAPQARARRTAPHRERIVMPEISNLFGPGGRGVSAANARDVEPIHIPALPVSPATGGQKPEDRVAAEARAAAALPATGETRRANVSIELTITEHRSDGPVQKTVTMLVSDRQNGSIRRQGVGGPAPAGTLNLDARPTVSADNSVLVYLSFVFLPGQQGRVGRDEPDSITELHESLTVLVTSGKPLLISEISDPAGNRRLVVQLKATVLP